MHDSYGGNVARLRQIKAAYDPDNHFRLTQNIRPAADGKRDALAA